MDHAEIKEHDDKALSALLLDMKKEQFNLRFQQANGVLENPARIRVVRRTIARIRTIERDRTRAANRQKG
ncbi:MAG: 50S ribosomal protein L29 [Pseudomonadota bacterium]